MVVGLASCALGCTSRRERAAPAKLHLAANPKPARSVASTDDAAVPADAAAGAQRFVVIGDYGASGPEEARVAKLTASFEPDFVITTGDNNYPLGGADTIDENVGRYFHDFIAPYRGKFGAGATENRFFPSLGNHDWYTARAQPYFDYFTLPNNERYYDVTVGSVQLFAIDSDPIEPDGVTADSKQALWLQERLAESTAPWKVVYFHHPPYSSGPHGSSLNMRWPFAEWGASIVFSGHDHTYERFDIAGMPYLVNGVGGNELYPLGAPVAGSVVRHADVHGLVLVTVTPTELTSRFFDARGVELDVLRSRKN
jgi:tartrate-resistant acid phosphatase type 5